MWLSDEKLKNIAQGFLTKTRVRLSAKKCKNVNEMKPKMIPKFP